MSALLKAQTPGKFMEVNQRQITEVFEYQIWNLDLKINLILFCQHWNRNCLQHSLNICITGNILNKEYNGPGNIPRDFNLISLERDLAIGAKKKKKVLSTLNISALIEKNHWYGIKLISLYCTLHFPYCSSFSHHFG